MQYGSKFLFFFSEISCYYQFGCSFQSDNEDLETSFGYIQLTDSQVFFKAYSYYKSQTSLSSGRIIVLSQVEENANVLSAYDRFAGKYTVPYPGNYSFTLAKSGYAPESDSSPESTRNIQVHVNNAMILDFSVTVRCQYYYSGSGYSNTRSCYYNLLDFEYKWQLELCKDDTVALYLTSSFDVGRASSKDKITWTGSLIMVSGSLPEENLDSGETETDNEVEN